MTYSEAIIVPSRIIFFMWLVFFVEQYYSIDLGVWGIYPRKIVGLVGIVAAPLLHGSVSHLVSNTLPLLVLGTTLYFFYDRIASRIWIYSWVCTGILVWLFGRGAYHIGASGLIYSLASFLIFFGIFRLDIKSLIISGIVFLLYNTMFYGVLPTYPGISWESHLMGAIVGLILAFTFRRVGKVSTST